MRGSRFIALTVLALAVVSVMGMSHAEPSGGCASGQVKPGDTPAGVGVYQFGDPTTGAGGVRLCNTGSTIPAPAKGALTISGDANAQYAVIYIDGDSNNTSPAPCTTGYDRIKVDSSGPHFWDGKTGGYSSTSPEKTADQWVQDVAADCAPA